MAVLIKYQLLIFFSALYIVAAGQQKANLVLVSRKTLEPVPFSSIISLDTKVGDYSDEKGRCSLSVNKGDPLFISSIGFISKRVVIRSAGVDTIFLEPSPDELEPVVVTPTHRMGYATFGIAKTRTDMRWALQEATKHSLN